MWRNQEISDFAQWLRAHNEPLPAAKRVSFRGLDLYSLRDSIASVLSFLESVDPAGAAEARKRYGCLTPWQDDPARYARAVMTGQRDACEDQAIAQLRELLDKRVGYAAADPEDYCDAAQNARVVRAAEHYYRTMYRGSKESWNLRDRHMFETLKHLLEHGGPEAKAVVWAHNSHVGHAGATAMGWQGEFNIGELCRTAFGDAAVLVGFSTDRGTVAAADDWDEPMRIKKVVPSRADSYERLFRDAGLGRSFTDLRASGSGLREALAKPRLERAIGVIYRPDTELQSHYFEAVLPEQFDAFVWIEETTAVTPLASETAEGMPETYPFGL
jgi:erythromycin esterase-like protein